MQQYEHELVLWLNGSIEDLLSDCGFEYNMFRKSM